MKRVSLLNELRDIVANANIAEQYDDEDRFYFIAEYKTGNAKYFYHHYKDEIERLENRAKALSRKHADNFPVPKTQNALKYIYENIDLFKRVIKKTKKDCKDETMFEKYLLIICKDYGMRTDFWNKDGYTKSDFLYAARMVPSAMLN